MLLILFGGSASGKTSLKKDLLKSDLGFSNVISTTTRQPRMELGNIEVDGEDYNFVTPEEFKMREANGRFANTTGYIGTRYGYEKAELAKPNGIIPVDLKSAHLVDTVFKPYNPYVIFLDISSSLLRMRMRIRGDNPEEIEKRINQDMKDVEEFKKERFNCPYIRLTSPLVINAADFFTKTLQFLQDREAMALPSGYIEMKGIELASRDMGKRIEILEEMKTIILRKDKTMDISNNKSWEDMTQAEKEADFRRSIKGSNTDVGFAAGVVLLEKHPELAVHLMPGTTKPFIHMIASLPKNPRDQQILGALIAANPAASHMADKSTKDTVLDAAHPSNREFLYEKGARHSEDYFDRKKAELHKEEIAYFMRQRKEAGQKLVDVLAVVKSSKEQNERR